MYMFFVCLFCMFIFSLNFHFIFKQVLKTPQVFGKADISVESLGDPFRPPDCSVVYQMNSNSTNSINSMSSNSNSSLSSSQATSIDGSSPSKRSRRKSIDRSRHGLMHRCAQDFWVPLVTSHSV